MQNAETVLGVLRERGRKGLPLDELYRQLFNPQLYLLAYGRIYSNDGAMTPGVTQETVDGPATTRFTLNGHHPQARHSHQRAGCRESWHVRFGGGPYGKGFANCGYLAVRSTQLVWLNGLSGCPGRVAGTARSRGIPLVAVPAALSAS